jgi:two-component system chemotaxis response regulator CheB
VIKVLVVDDSALVRKLIGQTFAREADFNVRFASNGLDALSQLTDFKPDVITLDIHMPQMGGLECLDRIMIERPSAVVIVSSLTAEGADTTLEALRLGAVDFVAKPRGAVSLHIEEFAPDLIAKVRSAANAKLRSSLRLKERVRHRIGSKTKMLRPARNAYADENEKRAAAGAGLVVVGVSTGGPPALEALLAPLPARFPWPIVVAQHMPRTFTSSLAKRLDGLCNLRVVEISAPVPLTGGFAYIARGDADIVVSRRAGTLTAMAAPVRQDYPWHPSTDRLVRSAMEHMPPSQLIGILMTGMGDDGAEAMAALRAGGGTTIAEAEETAVVWGMPGELVKLGGADWVLPLGKIAGRLLAQVPPCL